MVKFDQMKISFIGTGYVGLVSGTCFADLGNHVLCVDKDLTKLASLKKGKSPFYEPGLSEKIESNYRSERLTFSDSIEEAVLSSEIVFSAVGTPPLPDGEADLSAVFSVVDAVIAVLKKHECVKKVLVTKSTVPVGTGRAVTKRFRDAGLDSSRVAVVSNPEFLREGSAIHDFFHPDRIVLGSEDEDALNLMSQLYDPLYRIKTPIVKTTLETAELAKYAANAFLATKISYINEMANLCELMGADVKDISKIMGMDGRIGAYFLHPGPGYGGSCFPKDTRALVYSAEKLGYDLKIVKATESVNEAQKLRVVLLIESLFSADISGKKFAVLGLSFKPNTDDLRDSPAVRIIQALLERGAEVAAFDPEGMGNAKKVFGEKVHFVANSYVCAEGADGVILATEWNAFRELDLKRIKSAMGGDCFFDLRNVYEPEHLLNEGFRYYCVGRSQSMNADIPASIEVLGS